TVSLNTWSIPHATSGAGGSAVHPNTGRSRYEPSSPPRSFPRRLPRLVASTSARTSRFTRLANTLLAAGAPGSERIASVPAMHASLAISRAAASVTPSRAISTPISKRSGYGASGSFMCSLRLFAATKPVRQCLCLLRGHLAAEANQIERVEPPARGRPARRALNRRQLGKDVHRHPLVSFARQPEQPHAVELRELLLRHSWARGLQRTLHDAHQLPPRAVESPVHLQPRRLVLVDSRDQVAKVLVPAPHAADGRDLFEVHGVRSHPLLVTRARLGRQRARHVVHHRLDVGIHRLGLPH